MSVGTPADAPQMTNNTASKVDQPAIWLRAESAGNRTNDVARPPRTNASSSTPSSCNTPSSSVASNIARKSLSVAWQRSQINKCGSFEIASTRQRESAQSFSRRSNNKQSLSSAISPSSTASSESTSRWRKVAANSLLGNFGTNHSSVLQLGNNLSTSAMNPCLHGP